MQTSKKSRGFTLIEIVIVLAIAALIIMIVFAAFQNAQKSRRDQRRKSLATQMVGILDTYASNNAGKYNGFSCTNYCRSIADPDSPTGKPVSGSAGARATGNSGITYVTGAVCGSGGSAGSAVAFPGNAYAILFWSELSSSSLCLGNAGSSSAVALSGASGPAVGGTNTGVYAMNGGGISSCSPSAGNCMNWGGAGIWTAWAPTSFVYDISSLGSGTYKMSLYYKNSGSLPPSYSAFKINVYLDGNKVLANQSLPVDTAGAAPGPYDAPITVPSGTNKLTIEWTNDWCCGPSGEDANFVLNSFYMQ